MFHRSIVASVACYVIVAISAIVSSAAPETASKPAKEAPKVLMKNLRMEGQNAGKDAIELPRKKFLPIDADLEAGTWGFTRTPCFQFTYVPQDGPPDTFPEQVFNHPVVETDPSLSFSLFIFRGEELIAKNSVGGTVGLFGNEAKPWEGKVRYWLTTPDQPGEYTLRFQVSDLKADGIIGKPEHTVDLGMQRIVIP